MLYSKRDLPFLRKQADNKDLGATVRNYYKECIARIEKHGKINTEKVRDDGDGDS